MKFWIETLNLLERASRGVLLYVIQSEGSSPGRTGFRMFVSGSEMIGSIGGGIMEHKLVEYARSLMSSGRFVPFIRRQIHRAGLAEDRSGMICSGEQTIGMYYLDELDFVWLRELAAEQAGALELNPTGIRFQKGVMPEKRYELIVSGQEEWLYREHIGFRHTAYIVGAGHVGNAVSRVMREIGFHVVLMDDRNELNTFEANAHAHEKHIVDYARIEECIPEGEHVYVILVSFGYRTDAQVMRRLLGRRMKYFGVMGSVRKMETLCAELLAEGYSKDAIESVYYPIGIPVNSQTPEEIAVSIAAQIIQVKNSDVK